MPAGREAVAIEKGTRPARAAEVSILAEMLGCSMHELVTGRHFVADFAPALSGLVVVPVRAGHPAWMPGPLLVV